MLNKKTLTKGLISIVVITFLAGCILPRPMGGQGGPQGGSKGGGHKGSQNFDN